ncbi:hypothetical protein [Kibdelosporangium phytohabitans]|uniref:hypothetical protein n=1 Tax=Kibdelosporangium phytohabitans TaxID=860235 RepID=UPI0014702704|nr:hypothetical protein [Kibdelosporangium phytohabitans]MBE1471305.1 hypothetical protein [Kibdelosporangium phytohabitans]
MNITEADSIDELIADCADIPPSVRQSSSPDCPAQRLAPAWEVTEGCHAQVRDLDEYV